MSQPVKAPELRRYTVTRSKVSRLVVEADSPLGAVMGAMRAPLSAWTPGIADRVEVLDEDGNPVPALPAPVAE